MGDYEEKCRICGFREQLSDTWLDEFRQFHEKIHAVTLLENTKWLRFICISCRRRIYDFYDFKEFCTNTYQEILEGKEAAAGGGSVSTSESTDHDFCEDPSENEGNDAGSEELTFKLEAEEEAMYTEVVETVRLPEVKVRIERLDNCVIEEEEEAVAMPVEQEMESEEDQPVRRKRILKDSSNEVEIAERNTGEDKEGRTAYRCHSCDYKCFSRTALIGHNRSKHQSNSAKKSRKKIRICGRCRRGRKDKIQFTKQSDFLKHMEFHQRKICSYCSKVFDRNSHLIRHERTHTGDRPFVCEMCPMKTAFSQKVHLKNHIKRLHTKRRPTSNRLQSECNIPALSK